MSPWNSKSIKNLDESNAKTFGKQLVDLGVVLDTRDNIFPNIVQQLFSKLSQHRLLAQQTL